jgi:hypothetical protein
MSFKIELKELIEPIRTRIDLRLAFLVIKLLINIVLLNNLKGLNKGIIRLIFLNNLKGLKLDFKDYKSYNKLLLLGS